jgi:hypothetical protein
MAWNTQRSPKSKTSSRCSFPIRAVPVTDRIFVSDATSELAPRLINTFRAMFDAREIDRLESDLVQQGMAFFYVSGAGHEATATLARHLGPNDWLNLHYRDKALLLARGVPVDEFFSSLVAGGDSHSAGRQMSAHFSTPTLKVLSFVGPVGNNALQAVGIAAAVVGHHRDRPDRSPPALQEARKHLRRCGNRRAPPIARRLHADLLGRLSVIRDAGRLAQSMRGSSKIFSHNCLLYRQTVARPPEKGARFDRGFQWF